MNRRDAQGFSLLEVMVAVAILGLALTVILSAQGGLMTSTRRAANMANAVEYGRCKMSELEQNLIKMGYPEIDDLQSELPCCNDSTDTIYTCDTRVEKVLLPNPPGTTMGDGGLAPMASASGGANSPFLVNPAGSSAQLNLSTDALSDGGGLAALGGALNAAGGPDGLISMAMGIVYPTLKPMMEASIRRLTVTVRWKEGSIDKEIAMVQYVTNPQRGNLLNGVLPIPGASGSAGGLTPPPATTGTGTGAPTR